MAAMEIDSDMDDAHNDNVRFGNRTVNVMVSDVPGCGGTILLRLGSVDAGVTAGCVARALSKSILSHRGSSNNTVNINMDYLSYRLRCDGRILTDASQVISVPGSRDAYVSVLVSAALPGGKGGFGANLRGTSSANAKRSDNIGACRDLSGRRIRDVQLAQQQRDYNMKNKRPRVPGGGIIAAAVPLSPVETRDAPNETDNNNMAGATNVNDEVTELDVDVDEVEDQMRKREGEIEDDLMVGFIAVRKKRKLGKNKSCDISTPIKVPDATSL